MNICVLYGRLGTDPELKVFGETKICKFRMATNETFKDKQGQKQQRTSWHTIDVFGKQAESCAKYLKKGRQVVVKGKIVYDKNPETNITYTSIKAEKVDFINEQSKTQNNTQNDVNDWNDTDIPF
jgi:single-strand DNA-binding protein